MVREIGRRAALVGNSISNFHSSNFIYPALESLILSPRDDMYAQDSIDLLKASGIDFDRFERDGIDVNYFGELMMMSGLVLNDEVRWMTFHSSFDFGYLLKALTNSDLPSEESAFMDLLITFFPCIYDVKVTKAERFTS